MKRTVSASLSMTTSLRSFTPYPSGGTPPLHIPCFFEAAILSRMRSPMTSRSNCAKDNRTFRVKRPIEVVVLNCCVTETKEAPLASRVSAREGFSKTLTSSKLSAELPYLVTVEDEMAQAVYVADQVLEHREAGIDLRHQAVLFGTSHHSGRLEIELAGRNIPFVKYGGLKFIEAAHVKDLLAILRWAENPRDAIAGFRALQLLPGIGPASAKKAIAYLDEHCFDLGELAGFAPPDAAAVSWPGFCRMLQRLRDAATAWAGQVGLVRAWYQPHLERLYDYAPSRAGDLDQLEQIAMGYPNRERFLCEVTLDPPDAVGAEAGRPGLDEDYLILSTIHSAKGQEWDAVYVLNLVDGCIPSDMATGNPEQIEEDRRLLYV